MSSGQYLQAAAYAPADLFPAIAVKACPWYGEAAAVEKAMAALALPGIAQEGDGRALQPEPVPGVPEVAERAAGTRRGLV